MRKNISYMELRRLYKIEKKPITKIAKILGVSTTKIYSELAKTGLKETENSIHTTKKDCAKCQYHGIAFGEICCNYILVAKENRGCDARHCFRYKPGKQLKCPEDPRQRAETFKS